MGHKVAELEGRLLDLAVGYAQGWVRYPEDSQEHGHFWHTDPHRAPFGGVASVGSWTPSTDWSQAGPIIEREGITVMFLNEYGWAALSANIGVNDFMGYTCRNRDGWEVHDPNYLLATMRCFVMSKLGETVGDLK